MPDRPVRLSVKGARGRSAKLYAKMFGCGARFDYLNSDLFLLEPDLKPPECMSDTYKRRGRPPTGRKASVRKDAVVENASQIAFEAPSSKFCAPAFDTELAPSHYLAVLQQHNVSQLAAQF